MAFKGKRLEDRDRGVRRGRQPVDVRGRIGGQNTDLKKVKGQNFHNKEYKGQNWSKKEYKGQNRQNHESKGLD